MITTLSNRSLTAQINHKGAELISLKNKKNTEYIWNGNPIYWGKHSPVLFPIVGTLKNNQFQYKGEKYALSRHGFARDLPFILIEKSDNYALFSLVNSDTTLLCYPFEFELTIGYTLTENDLKITYQVTNKNNFLMPFSIGAHPAFALPKSFEDYHLRFEKEEEVITFQLENDLISDKTIILPIIRNNLKLNYALFKNDALIIKKMKSNFITIIEKSKPILRIKFEDFPNLGIWTKNNAPFICIEPWQGYSDTIENSGDLFEKEGIQIVNANENFNCEFSIEIL